MIELHRHQLRFADGLIREEIGPLWDDWLRQVDAATFMCERGGQVSA